MAMRQSETVAVLIVAAGRGVRAGGGMPKQYRSLAGTAVLRHTAEAFLRHPRVGPVLVAIHPDDEPLYEEAVRGLRLLPPALGGATRQESVRNGLDALAGKAPGLVLIHDAARPLVSRALIDRVLEALETSEGALPVLPITDTVKRVGGDGFVMETIPRTELFRAQTPQGFRFDAIRSAHQGAGGEELTDDAAVAEQAGLQVQIVDGAEENIKLTHPEDFAAAERTLGAGGSAEPLIRVATGTGFDVHRFGPGEAVMLCGIAVPHSHGLVGHSDADVGLHAITDALLGAIGAGDIGQHFPPTDERWRGAPSDRFLAHALELAREAGARLTHVDLTLICERPKIGPHRPAMQANVARILELEPARVNIKATTTEGLGFTGRREGIAAQASATVVVAR